MKKKKLKQELKKLKNETEGLKERIGVLERCIMVDNRLFSVYKENNTTADQKCCMFDCISPGTSSMVTCLCPKCSPTSTAATKSGDCSI